VRTDEVRRLFAEARVARLATTSKAGPHVVPICFALENETIYWAVDEKPKRTRALRRLTNIEAEPRVSVLVDRYDEDWSRLWWARADGDAHVLEDERDREAALRLLTAKYEQYAAEFPRGPAVAIEVRRWSGWSA
jgi:PPOX class probable F420-dependent enzyme